VVLACCAEPSLDEFEIRLRCRDAALRFLLKGVQDIDRAGELDRIDRPIRTAVVILDDFENAGALELFVTGEGLCGGMLAAAT
jgi:hypothetical protein